jgi:hypothetical protein
MPLSECSMPLTRPLTIIITMAGNGQRFLNAGYTVPKYEIEVQDKTLFCWAVESLGNFLTKETHVIFIARKAFNPEAFINQECKKLGIEQFGVVLLEDITDGQATTVLCAQQASIAPENPILVYNIDTHVRPEVLSREAMFGDGWIPCFPGKGNGWSFVKVENHNQAVEVREKQRISEHATIGLYGFSSFSLYQNAYKHYYACPEQQDNLNRTECRERYIAPLYNHLIAEGRLVQIATLPENSVYPLGTPEEVEAFKQGNVIDEKLKPAELKHGELKHAACLGQITG